MPSRTDIAANVLGTVGGVFLSVCLLPQLYRIYRTRSAADLDYSWMALYGAGLALNLAYLVLAKAPVGAAFHAVELGLVFVMVGAKAALERGLVPSKGGAADAAADHPGPPVPPTRGSGSVAAA